MLLEQDEGRCIDERRQDERTGHSIYTTEANITQPRAPSLYIVRGSEKHKKVIPQCKS
jgi:hypothetical protein